MKKNIIRRTLSVLSAAALCAVAVGSLAACTTDFPEVTITYTFNGEDYAVDYQLCREAAPRTVQHFIDLADAGYYDGTCIHDYSESFLYGGGYTLENGELKAKDYFAEVKRLEKEGASFEQSVYLTGENGRPGDPLYTVYGEMSDNGYEYSGSRSFSHSTGALVMYYNYDASEDGNEFSELVTVKRNDNGQGREDKKEYEQKSYTRNSATSLFYTFTGENRSDLAKSYCVFGKVKDWEKMESGLLAAISEYKSSHEDDDFTTQSEPFKVYEYDHYPMDETYLADYSQGVKDFFRAIRGSGITRTYNTPLTASIVIKSVKVTKY